MPLVTVEIWEGRSVEIKRKLVKDITKVIVDDIGCPKEAVSVIIRDVPMNNWGIDGELASDRFKQQRTC